MDCVWLQWRLWFQLLSLTSGRRSNPFLWKRVPNISYRFVHERGFRTAIFNLGVLGGINLAVPIGKKSKLLSFAQRLITELPAAAIIQYSSYHEALYGMGGAFALAFILVFFWMPESAFKREALNIDTGENQVSLLKIHHVVSLTC